MTYRGRVFFEDGEEVCELEELGEGRFRVVKVCGEKQEIKMPCFVCGVRKPITEMWSFVELDGWRMFPFCSEECYLAFNLKRRRDKWEK